MLPRLNLVSVKDFISSMNQAYFLAFEGVATRGRVSLVSGHVKLYEDLILLTIAPLDSLDLVPLPPELGLFLHDLPG